jgi:ABC-type multidrug transport system ATPase subunit
MEEFPVFVAFVALFGSASFLVWLVVDQCRHFSALVSDQISVSTKSDTTEMTESSKHANSPSIKLSYDPNDEWCEKRVLLSWRNVSCSYPSRMSIFGTQENPMPALHNSHGELVAGELSAIMGESGGGKTTLLNILSGRKAVGSITGEVSMNGKTLTDMSIAGSLLRNVVAYVPQDEAFFPMQTAEEAVKFVANLCHGRDRYSDDDIRSIFHEVGLRDVALYSRPIGGSLAGGLQICGLSGGEKKRLALACALVMEPELMMLDEITR